MPNSHFHPPIPGHPTWRGIQDCGQVSKGGGKDTQRAAIPEWISPEARLDDIDKFDIERQVLSPSNPFCYFDEDNFNKYWSQAYNDLIAEACMKYPDRFLGFITVPLRNVDDAIEELYRAARARKMVGVVLGSNLGNKPLDSPDLIAFMKRWTRSGSRCSFTP